MKRRILLAAALLASAASPAVLAQDRYPSKPITYIVPFGAGGTTAPLLPHPRLAVGPRIGLREEASHPELFPWRYRIAGDPTVSGPDALNR